jgi:hypothetical protein
MRFALLILGLIATAPIAAEPPTLSPAERAEIHGQLDRRWSMLAGEPKANLGVRELFAFGLEAAGSGWHPERLAQVYALAGRFQDRTPGSRSRGNFRWAFGDAAVNDANAVEFTMEMAALTLAFYRADLAPEARDLLTGIVGEAIPALRAQRVTEEYTNIFLIRCWNCIALGEAQGDADLAAFGYAQLLRWHEVTARNGIGEYNSPTYTGVTLDALGLIARWARQPAGRTLAESGLGLVWSSIAANWSEPGQRLGGAHSRDYDYLTGHGRVEAHAQAAGWLPAERSVPGDVLPLAPSVFWQYAQWTPPAAWRVAAGSTVPRTVVERVGAQPWQRLVHYVGRHFCLGSAGATYGNMDQPVVMCFPGGERVPMLSLFLDGRGDPYGNRRIAAGGHQKSLHLTPVLASVQRGPEVLVALSLDPAGKNLGHRREDLTQLATQLVLPRMDAIFCAGHPAPASGFPIPLDTAVVAVKGDVALGIRILVASGEGGAVAPCAWIDDGGATGACRITLTHAPGVPTQRATAALWLRAVEGLDAAGVAAFATEFAAAKAVADQHPGQLRLDVAGCQGPLTLALDLARGERIILTGGEPPIAGLLQVNGVEIGRPFMLVPEMPGSGP